MIYILPIPRCDTSKTTVYNTLKLFWSKEQLDATIDAKNTNLTQILRTFHFLCKRCGQFMI